MILPSEQMDTWGHGADVHAPFPFSFTLDGSELPSTRSEDRKTLRRLPPSLMPDPEPIGDRVGEELQFRSLCDPILFHTDRTAPLQEESLPLFVQVADLLDGDRASG